MFSPMAVGLFYGQDYSKSYEVILTKLGARMGNGT